MGSRQLCGAESVVSFERGQCDGELCHEVLQGELEVLTPPGGISISRQQVSPLIGRKILGAGGWVSLVGGYGVDDIVVTAFSGGCVSIHHGVEAVEFVAVGADGIVPVERRRAGLASQVALAVWSPAVLLYTAVMELPTELL